MLRVKEVAALFGVAPLTVRRWMATGKLAPLFRSGKIVRIPQRTIDAFVGERLA